MAELATIARPYAEALFKSSQTDVNGTSQWLDALAAVAANQQLLQFADNPKVQSPQVYDVVSDVARVQLPPAGQNFLRTVIDNGRLAALQKRFGRKLNASVVVDPELIGGIRVVVGDEVLDTSIRARLEQMKAALSA